MDSHTGHAAAEAKRFNWWKLAFFVALVAFEIAREQGTYSISPSATKSACSSAVSQRKARPVPLAAISRAFSIFVP